MNLDLTPFSPFFFNIKKIYSDPQLQQECQNKKLACDSALHGDCISIANEPLFQANINSTFKINRLFDFLKACPIDCPFGIHNDNCRMSMFACLTNTTCIDAISQYGICINSHNVLSCIDQINGDNQFLSNQQYSNAMLHCSGRIGRIVLGDKLLQRDPQYNRILFLKNS